MAGEALINQVGSAIENACAALVPKIRLNSIEMGRTTVTKRRNSFGRLITGVANAFLQWCDAPSAYWTDLHDWQQWEVECFRMLHPTYRAAPLGENAVREARLPGESLWTHLRRGTLTYDMLRAAGREVRRAHGLVSPLHDGAWSHGDGAMCNVLHDPATGRARLIDFELVHRRDLPETVRQADDLLAFLLDLTSFKPGDKFLPAALAFLKAYGRPQVLAELRPRLVMPRSTGRIWWMIRANFLATQKLRRRVAQLAGAFDDGALGPVGKPAFTPPAGARRFQM